MKTIFIIGVKGKENVPILTHADDINDGGSENENPKNFNNNNKKKLSG